MASVKEEALRLIETIPDDASWDDIMYEFYVRATLGIGLEAVDAGGVVSHAEVEKRFCSELAD